MDTTAKDEGGGDPDYICVQRCQSMDMVTEGERSVFYSCVYVYYTSHVPGSLRWKKIAFGGSVVYVVYLLKCGHLL